MQQEYSDLSEEMLAKEVLAEAIGREGAYYQAYRDWETDRKSVV